MKLNSLLFLSFRKEVEFQCDTFKLRETPKAVKRLNQASDNTYLWEYFNTFISACRFIKIRGLDSTEYQGLNESLNWLREYLKGNNLTDNNGQSAAKLLQDTSDLTEKVQRLNVSGSEEL